MPRDPQDPPVDPPAEPPADERAPGPEPLDVLVVDDEPAVAGLVRTVLARDGLSVEAVHGAEEALAALRARPPRVVLTDYTMPEVNGLELVRRLDAEGVGAAYLIMSAYLEPPVAAEVCAEPAVAGVLAKPFQLKELVRDVRAVLAAAGGPDPASQDPSTGPDGGC